jgi:hypothetical protein
LRYEFSTYKSSYNFLEMLKDAGDDAVYDVCKLVILERFKRSVRTAYYANDAYDTLKLNDMGILVPGSESFRREMRIKQRLIPVRKLVTGAHSAAVGIKNKLIRREEDLTIR